MAYKQKFALQSQLDHVFDLLRTWPERKFESVVKDVNDAAAKLQGANPNEQGIGGDASENFVSDLTGVSTDWDVHSVSDELPPPFDKILAKLGAEYHTIANSIFDVAKYCWGWSLCYTIPGYDAQSLYAVASIRAGDMLEAIIRDWVHQQHDKLAYVINGNSTGSRSAQALYYALKAAGAPEVSTCAICAALASQYHDDAAYLRFKDGLCNAAGIGGPHDSREIGPADGSQNGSIWQEVLGKIASGQLKLPPPTNRSAAPAAAADPYADVRQYLPPDFDQFTADVQQQWAQAVRDTIKAGGKPAAGGGKAANVFRSSHGFAGLTVVDIKKSPSYAPLGAADPANRSRWAQGWLLGHGNLRKGAGT